MEGICSEEEILLGGPGGGPPSFVTFQTSFDIAGPNIILLYRGRFCQQIGVCSALNPR